ncbi:putative RNA polymerase sigma-54 factor [Gottschalkia purinilytica]|uniref:Putative RNA polymerase sigma-54 factor n=1 Tax=Gottschalkia purinilytica TaxID=1503 RepID=A0A0L0W882_GOTPU|nr:RNA polymerase factor sigma-54 [Gottschalkia purinilytica]KNF07470.1 putative RNA polymerase sigma-54 factor [Gottschalkia purinilytica]
MLQSFDLNLSQSQKLIITPRLKQAIRILQFNNQELYDYLQKEMEKNPLIEINDNYASDENRSLYTKQEYNIDWKKYLDHNINSGYYKSYSVGNNDKPSFQNFMYYEKTLKEYLMFQFNLCNLKGKDKKIGEFIIESLDDNGYLNNTVEEISAQVNESHKKVESILKVIQTFDPYGVGARDLKECLTIQLNMKKINNLTVYHIINKHLEDVGKNRLNKIAKSLNINIAEVQKSCDLIKSLEPKPGREFNQSGNTVKYIKPDIILHHINNEYIVQSNETAHPNIIISNFYKQLLNNSNDKNTINFLTDKLNSALWLSKILEQRKCTIKKVSSSILKFQIDFFNKNILNPLTLQDVANDIGVHQSTVSRATNGKYIQTPKGIFELKFFFSNKVEIKDGYVSSSTIKSLIKEIIQNEDCKKPFSDQEISNILESKKINISRRTVAKYRDELGIPSSPLRKRF